MQCRSVGFFASDIGVANFGIEGRSIFARRSVASVGLSSNPRVLLSGRVDKSILVDLYRAAFGSKPAAKAGFAGYPNEMCKLVKHVGLSQAEKELFALSKQHLSERDYMWKEINYKLFKSRLNVSL